MDVQLLFVEDCPNVDVARQRLAEAVRRVGATVEIRERLVPDEATAMELGMSGSPTLLVAGADVAEAGQASSLSCRLYPTATGYDVAPDVATIEAALIGGSGRSNSAAVDRSEVARLVAVDDAQLVEVLPQDEYDEEHIEEAIHLPLKELSAKTAGVLDRARPLIVYCWDGL